MGARYLDAQYEWNWSSLTGGLQGVLRHLGLPHDAATVSVATGDAFRVPTPGSSEAFAEVGYRPRSLAALADDLNQLGLRAEVIERDLRHRGAPRFLRWRLKRQLGRGRPIVAYGAGFVGAGGQPAPEFGLLVGYDDARSAYRLQGPLTDEVDPWLPYDRLVEPAARWLALVLARPGSNPGPAPARAREQALAIDASGGLERWIALLESEATIDPVGHAYWVQTLAARRAEAARFWRGAADDDPQLAPLAERAQAEALSLSRFATLYPYPRGGDVIGGGRAAGAAALRQALRAAQAVRAELERLDTLPAVSAGA